HINRGRVDGIYRLALMLTDIDADFRHDLNGMGVDLLGHGTRTHHLDLLAKEHSPKALGHLTAGGIGDTQKQYSGHAHSSRNHQFSLCPRDPITIGSAPDPAPPMRFQTWDSPLAGLGAAGNQPCVRLAKYTSDNIT